MPDSGKKNLFWSESQQQFLLFFDVSGSPQHLIFFRVRVPKNNLYQKEGIFSLPDFGKLLGRSDRANDSIDSIGQNWVRKNLKFPLGFVVKPSQFRNKIIGIRT